VANPGRVGRVLRENEARAKDIGRKGSSIFVWIACPECGRERWVTTHYIYRGRHYLCKSCAAKHSPKASWDKTGRWKGGKNVAGGYIRVLLKPDDFFYPMAKLNKGTPNRYVFEHRLVMATHLGRCLQSWELVHHKGIRHSGIENKQDNLIDNLELSTQGSHSLDHSRGYQDGYRKGYLDGKRKAQRELNKRESVTGILNAKRI